MPKPPLSGNNVLAQMAFRLGAVFIGSSIVLGSWTLAFAGLLLIISAFIVETD